MVRIVPLGGLGEFGLNSLVVETPEGLVLVDAGLMFGRPDQPSVGAVHPDFSYVEAHADRFRAVVLTHAHEDHLGALPSLLARLPVPVYGTKLTLGFLAHKLDEAGVTAELRELSPREELALAPGLTAEALHVTHSMPGAVGYAFHTAHGTVVHTGDFKLDPTPPDGRPTDLERFGELGDRGVSLLLSDSTNAEHEEPSGSEADVKRALGTLLSLAPGRVIVTMFASSLHRAQVLLELAHEQGRRVVLHGRSMVRNVELAVRLGHLHPPEGLLVSQESQVTLAPRQVLVLATGAQGEPRSALWQMAYGEASALEIERGDTVVVSARAIPGNEPAIDALLAQLERRGARVVRGPQEPPIHVSGHGTRPDQRRMLELCRPRTFVPIHGEPRQLHRHLELAQAHSPQAQSLLLRDGDLLELSEGGAPARITGNVLTQRRPLDRFTGGVLGPEVLKERTVLAELGLVVAALVLDVSRRVVVRGPVLHGRGLAPEEEALLGRVAQAAAEEFSQLSPALYGDEALVREELTRAVRKAWRAHSAKRPNVLPVVLRL